MKVTLRCRSVSHSLAETLHGENVPEIPIIDMVTIANKQGFSMRCPRVGKYVIFFILLAILGGCSSPPSKSTIEEVIIKHFKKRQYIVADLSIGDIIPLPMGEKQYMGTEAYLVSIPSLTLEFTRDVGEPWNYKKDTRKTFNNARIKIKKGTGNRAEWLIGAIEGIPAR